MRIAVSYLQNGKHIDEKFAYRYIDAVTAGIDFTARDLQSKQKEKGLPWEIAKAFDNSAVVGDWNAISNESDFSNINFSMKKNEVIVQKANSCEMLFGIPTIIHYISSFLPYN